MASITAADVAGALRAARERRCLTGVMARTDQANYHS
jgi:hypothetical protein